MNEEPIMHQTLALRERVSSMRENTQDALTIVLTAYEELESELYLQDALNAKLEEALSMLYEETADYIRVNHLGDMHHNSSMKLARAALDLTHNQQERMMSKNPYLLHGDELARTEAARMAGQSQPATKAKLETLHNAKPNTGEYTKGTWSAYGSVIELGTPNEVMSKFIASCNSGAWSMSICHANAQRIVACVNACEAMDDPDAEIADVMENVRLLRIERDALAARVAKLEDGLEQALDAWRTAILHLPGSIHAEIDRIAKLRILLAKHGR